MKQMKKNLSLKGLDSISGFYKSLAKVMTANTLEQDYIIDGAKLNTLAHSIANSRQAINHITPLLHFHNELLNDSYKEIIDMGLLVKFLEKYLKVTVINLQMGMCLLVFNVRGAFSSMCNIEDILSTLIKIYKTKPIELEEMIFFKDFSLDDSAGKLNLLNFIKDKMASPQIKDKE